MTNFANNIETSTFEGGSAVEALATDPVRVSGVLSFASNDTNMWGIGVPEKISGSLVLFDIPYQEQNLSLNYPVGPVTLEAEAQMYFGAFANLVWDIDLPLGTIDLDYDIDLTIEATGVSDGVVIETSDFSTKQVSVTTKGPEPHKVGVDVDLNYNINAGLHYRAAVEYPDVIETGSAAVDAVGGFFSDPLGGLPSFETVYREFEIGSDGLDFSMGGSIEIVDFNAEDLGISPGTQVAGAPIGDWGRFDVFVPQRVDTFGSVNGSANGVLQSITAKPASQVNFFTANVDFDALALGSNFLEGNVQLGTIPSFIPQIGGQKTQVDYTILDIDGDAGIGLWQEFDFDPTSVEVTYNFFVGAEQIGDPKKGRLGDRSKFELPALTPEQIAVGGGKIEVRPEFELVGTFTNRTGIRANFDVSALVGELSILGYDLIDPPLFDGNLAGWQSEPFYFFSRTFEHSIELGNDPSFNFLVDSAGFSEGTDGPDLFVFPPQAVGYDARGGSDVVTGNALANVIYGGEGDDELLGHGGEDLLFGDQGDDDLSGGAGDDTLSGGEGRDETSGGSGNDIFLVDNGDLVPGEIISGDSGWDTLQLLNGGVYDLTPVSLSGIEALGLGHETSDDYDITLTAGFLNSLDGILGMLPGDILRLQSSANVDLRSIGSYLPGTIIGAGGSDTFRAPDQGARLDGGGGNDRITGGPARDILRGGAGNDLVEGGDGPDDIGGGSGDDLLEGQSGNDAIAGGPGRDMTYGGSGNDRFLVGLGDLSALGELFDGGPGSDVIELTQIGTYDFSKSDIGSIEVLRGIDSGSLANRLHVILSNDQLQHIGRFEQFFLGIIELADAAKIDLRGKIDDPVDILGSNDNDEIVVWRKNAMVYGRDGDDTFSGADLGRYFFFGGPGNDTLNGASWSDELDGGPGDDILNGGFNDDILRGGPGDDLINGGGGFDTVEYEGHSSEYSLDFQGTTITVTSNRPEDAGTDTLTFVESLLFSDGAFTDFDDRPGDPIANGGGSGINDDFLDLDASSRDDPIIGLIEKDGDTDWFYFRATEGVSYRVVVDDVFHRDFLGAGGTIDLRTRIFDVKHSFNGVNPISQDLSLSIFGEPALVEETEFSSDTHSAGYIYVPDKTNVKYIAVDGFESFNPIGGYEISVQVIDDDVGNDPEGARHIEIGGGPHQAGIQYLTDTDWFSFDAVAGESYKVSFINNSLERASLKLHSDVSKGVDDWFVSNRISADTETTGFSFVAHEDGPTFIEVSGAYPTDTWRNGSIGDYSVTVEVVDDFTADFRGEAGSEFVGREEKGAPYLVFEGSLGSDTYKFPDPDFSGNGSVARLFDYSNINVPIYFNEGGQSVGLGEVRVFPDSERKNFPGIDASNSVGSDSLGFKVGLDLNFIGTDHDDTFLTGGFYENRYLVTPGRGNDYLVNTSNNPDVLTVSFQDAPEGVSIDLPDEEAAVGTTGELDILIGSPFVIGSSFDDSFKGDDANNQFEGGDGDDVSIWSAGSDYFVGGNGYDQLVVDGSLADFEFVELDSGDRAIKPIGGSDQDISVVAYDVEEIRFNDATLLGNRSPTGLIADRALQVSENAPAGTSVAIFSALDEDDFDTHEFQLLDDAGGRFALDGNTLKVAPGADIDYEAAAHHTVRLSVTDGLSPAYEEDLVVEVTNMPISGIELVSGGSVLEDAFGGTVVAVFQALENPPEASASFSIVDGAGGDFVFNGNQLVVSPQAALNYSSQSNYLVTVSATDGTGPVFQETFSIVIDAVGTIIGTPDVDVLNGTIEDDVIRALESDDIINASEGYDLLDGNAGTDSVVYGGSRSDYQHELLADGRIRVDKPGGDSDSLVEIERISFDDGSLLYDVDSPNLGFGYRVYQASFARTPDEGGVLFWIGVLDQFDEQGQTDYQKQQFLARQFIQSDEFRDLYGENPTNEQYIDAMYLNVLFRLPDQSGYDFWVGGMEQGLSREDILIAFTQSDENISNTAPNLDDGVWVI